MFRWSATSLILALGLQAHAAPPPQAVPASQRGVTGNACGPTALLNAFRFGNPAWQRASSAIPGKNDQQRITSIIQEHGMRPSNHITGHPRWSRKGVNLVDLQDIANEIARPHSLPLVNDEVLFLIPGETQAKLLKRVHQRFNTSLANGLPPVVSLRRYVKRARPGKPPEWIVLDAHFVTLTDLPPGLGENARSFPITYIDPWGGKTCQGVIGIPDRAILGDSAVASPCLEANFPEASVGKILVRAGEPGALTVAAVLGRW
jgi:hypothetical protein